jgi:UDP-glucose 4-epimerase
MKLLIPGGAGYIGSHMVRYAQEHGHEVVVLDDFSTGHEWAIKDCEILRVNLLDKDKLSKLLKGSYFDGVIHFAAKSLVSESVRKPDLYYRNNVVGTLNLVNEMLKNDVNNLVFSSTAAIFGNPVTDKITENHPKNPINPYGQSKLMVENILQDICSVNDFNATCLRYFNAAGAHESGEIGESHDPETHLIPNILKAALLNKNNLKVFGDDYPTPDGTCVRDYVHVTDLAQAHLLSLRYMQKNKGFSAFNLGNGEGFSVLQVIKSCEKIANTKISFQIEERREGDPPVLVSENKLAVEVINWNPKYNDINDIIKGAWFWHNSEEC